MLDAAIIVLNYNGLRRHGTIFKKSIETILKSVDKTLNEGYRIRVVFADNASSDRSFEFVYNEYYPMYKESLLLLKLQRNYGFARGNNISYYYAKMKLGAFRYVIFINSDVIVTNCWLIRLLEVLDLVKCVNIGLAQPLTLTYNIYFKYPEKDIYSALKNAYNNKNALIETDIINGYCTAMSSNTFEKLGGWDETFFLYGEDIDISLKALSQGYKNVKILTSIVFHEAGLPRLSYSVLYEVLSRYLVLSRYTRYLLKNAAFFILTDLLRFVYHLTKGERVKIYSLLSAYSILIRRAKILILQRKMYNRYRRNSLNSRIVEHYFNRLAKDLISRPKQAII